MHFAFIECVLLGAVRTERLSGWMQVVAQDLLTAKSHDFLKHQASLASFTKGATAHKSTVGVMLTGVMVRQACPLNSQDRCLHGFSSVSRSCSPIGIVEG